MLVPSIPNRFWSGPVIEVWFVVEVVIPRRKTPVGATREDNLSRRVWRDDGYPGIDCNGLNPVARYDSSQTACAELLPPALRW